MNKLCFIHHKKYLYTNAKLSYNSTGLDKASFYCDMYFGEISNFRVMFIAYFNFCLKTHIHMEEHTRVSYFSMKNNVSIFSLPGEYV